MKYEMVTAGEGLAYLVSTKLLAQVPWDKLAIPLLMTGRSEQLLEFFEELTIVNLTCRIVAAGTSLLKEREGRKARSPDDPTWEADYREYMRISLHTPPKHVDQIFRQATRAVRASLNDITANERAKFKKKAQLNHKHCYMCNVALDFSETDSIRKFTMEHLWPQCYGGDSIEENLLPACGSCNSSKKMECASWAMPGIQSLIFGFAPSDNELQRVRGPHRFALHHYAARRLAAQKNITLRRAFLLLKPWTDVRVANEEDMGDFFNLANHQPAGYLE